MAVCVSIVSPPVKTGAAADYLPVNGGAVAVSYLYCLKKTRRFSRTRGVFFARTVYDVVSIIVTAVELYTSTGCCGIELYTTIPGIYTTGTQGHLSFEMRYEYIGLYILRWVILCVSAFHPKSC